MTYTHKALPIGNHAEFGGLTSEDCGTPLAFNNVVRAGARRAARRRRILAAQSSWDSEAG